MDTGATELAVKRLVRFDGGSSLKAYVDVEIRNWFLIKGVRVVQGRNGLFVSMPRQQGKNGQWYDSVIALSKDAKTHLSRVVLDSYQEQSDTPS